MSLEGNQGDRFTGEPITRRARPVTLEYAVANIPQIILLLKRRQLTVHRRMVREGPPIFYLYRPARPWERWFLLESDFLRVKQVASEVDVNLFQSDTEQDVLARIRARVQVEWA